MTRPRNRVPVLESIYIKQGDGHVQIDEHTLLGEDGGIADLLDLCADEWHTALDGRQVFIVDLTSRPYKTSLMNTQTRKEFAEHMRRKQPEDNVLPAWLTAKRSEHARLFVLLPSASSLLIEASHALPKVRRHHLYGYRIAPGSTDAMIYGYPKRVTP